MQVTLWLAVLKLQAHKLEPLTISASANLCLIECISLEAVNICFDRPTADIQTTCFTQQTSWMGLLSCWLPPHFEARAMSWGLCCAIILSLFRSSAGHERCAKLYNVICKCNNWDVFLVCHYCSTCSSLCTLVLQLGQNVVSHTFAICSVYPVLFTHSLRVLKDSCPWRVLRQFNALDQAFRKSCVIYGPGCCSTAFYSYLEGALQWQCDSVIYLGYCLKFLFPESWVCFNCYFVILRLMVVQSLSSQLCISWET